MYNINNNSSWKARKMYMKELWKIVYDTQSSNVVKLWLKK